MSDPDWFALLHDYAKRTHAEVELVKVFQGWIVRLVFDDKELGRANGENPLVAYELLCKELGIEK